MSTAEYMRPIVEGTLGATEYTLRYLREVQELAAGIDPLKVDKMVEILAETRDNHGRVFFVGVGGGAGHASHAVNDFRKIAGIECYSPSDNVSELTARINDDGWETSYANILRGSGLREGDTLCVFSVGGGNLEKNVSANIVKSVQLAKEVGAKVIGIVGRDGGYTAQAADVCVIVPTISPETTTAHTEEFQAVIWHLLVSHPGLKKNEMKWESTK